MSIERPAEAPPERFNFAAHLLALNASRGPKAAFVDDSGLLTYAALEARVRRVAAGLRGLGLRREERVLLLMQDGLDWPVAFLGALYAGLVPVAVNTLLTADDYAYMLEHSRAQAALVSGALLPALNAAMVKSDHEVQKVVVSRPVAPLHPAELDFEIFTNAQAPLAKSPPTGRDDPALWLYSSGSTGRPKGTVHSHANPYWTAELYGRRVLGLREDDVCFSAAKLFFAYGLGNALSFPLSVGATVLLMGERPTPEATFCRWRGEVHGPGGDAHPSDLRPTAFFGAPTGWPVPGYEIRLRADDGGPVPDGEPGDLYIHGPSPAMMYWGNAAKSRDTFQGGWTKSGDKYIRNADGTYTYGGRSDDMLKVSGIYVSPFEVEATLVQHPAVLEAAVIGVPDAEGLTKTKAFVVPRAGAEVSEAELKAFVKDKLAPYKYPRLIEFVNELPKTATGKIQRYKLREREVRA